MHEGRFVAVLLMAIVAGTAGARQADELTGSCTIVLRGDSGAVLDHTQDPPDQYPLERGSLVERAMAVRTDEGNKAAVLLRYAEQDAGRVVGNVALYLDEKTTVKAGAEDETRRVLEVTGGTAVVYYAATDRLPLLVTTSRGWAQLAGGTLHVVVAEGSVKFRLGVGAAVLFDGPLPDGDPNAAKGGKPLSADAAARAQAGKLISQLNQHRILGLAPAAWLVRAEGGDFVPTAVVGVSAADIAASFGSGRKPVDQAGQVQSVSVAPVTVSVTASGMSQQVQSLLGSTDPASVVVGARLLRTRIVGNPGGAAGSGIRFNLQSRGLLEFGLGR